MSGNDLGTCRENAVDLGRAAHLRGGGRALQSGRQLGARPGGKRWVRNTQRANPTPELSQ
jgi:hypothetical protein